MRKATILIIAAIYVASIVIVGVFGLQSLVYTEVVYVTDIVIAEEIGGSTVQQDEDGGDYTVTIRHNFSDSGDTLIVPIEWTPIPSDATYRNNIKVVVQKVSGGDEPCATLKQDIGWSLEFVKNGSVTVCIMSVDANKVKKELTIYVGRNIEKSSD